MYILYIYNICVWSFVLYIYICIFIDTHTIPCHVISHIISYQIISNQIKSYHITSRHVTSRHVMLYVCVWCISRVWFPIGLTPILFGWCFPRVILLFWQSEARLFQSVESVGLQGIGFPHLSWRRWAEWADELFATDGLLYTVRHWCFMHKWWPAQVVLWSLGRKKP